MVYPQHGAQHILIVDDCPSIAQYLSCLLAEAGYRATIAPGGGAALAQASAAPPDLILLDVEMPDLSGFEVCRRLKADKRVRHVPVLFISSRTEAAEKVRGFEAGGVDFLVKPFQAEEVLARVAVHLRLRELTERLEQAVRRRTDALMTANQRLRLEVAERAQAEKEIRTNSRLLQSILDNSTAVIYIKDRDGRYLLVNRRFEELFDVAKGGVLGKTDYDLFPRDRADAYRASDRQVLQTAAPLDSEEMARHDDGPHTYLSTKAPLLDQDGNVDAICGIAADITALKKAEQENLSHLHFLESLELADRAIHQAGSLDEMMTGVLDACLAIFGSDRAWLLYPCDPDAPTWHVPMERTRSEFPGAMVMGTEIPTTAECAELFRTALDSSEPVTFDPHSSRAVPPDISRQFSVRSQITVAIYPKRGKPWLFGMHQCSHPRIWEERDVQLFKEISRRIGDGLASLLFLRDLQESRERLSSTLASMDDLVFVLDKHGRIVDYFQPQDKPGAHGGPELLLEKSFSEALPRETAEPLESAINAVMLTGLVQQVEYPITWEGGERWYSAKASVRRDAAGAFAGVTIVARDVTETKGTEEALRRLSGALEQRVEERTSELEAANRELTLLAQRLENAYDELKSAHLRVLQQEKMASIGQLAAGVAHEINNPMGYIISNLNTLQKYSQRICDFLKFHSETVKALPCHQQDGCSEITGVIEQQKKAMKLDYVISDLPLLVGESLEGAERVKAIVQNLKTFSRVESGEVRISADINAGLESTINIIWNELKYKAVVNREYGVIPATRCNLGQLNQVFLNLLMNAAQAIETQGVITVKTWSDGERIWVAISDNGTGIPDHVVQKIFEPFYTTKEVGEGTGLGLSIAYDIVKQHDGEITVQSSAGKGATFTIAIPVVS